MATILKLDNVSKLYGSLRALDGVTLSLPDNAYISLLGPSGSGKTTLLRVIAGFERQDGGGVLLAGESLDGVPAHRRNIGFVFQNFALFPHLSVARNISFGLENSEGTARPSAGVIAAKVRDIVALTGLGGLEERGVAQISGGQRQRVALARTLVTEPGLVLLDEPLGALDANLRTRMRDELRAIRERLGVTFLHVTGSETEALAMGDSLIVLDRGRIGQIDAPDTVYNRPASPAVARFLNCYNLFEGSLGEGAFVGPAGRFALDAAAAASKGGGPAYAVRHDRIEVRPPAAPAGADEVRIEGAFVASEYTGATQLSFFRLDDGRLVEVEAHLSHRSPAAYGADERYGLVWKRRDALVYA
ncbi:ABC transporter ATP-binding protein [Chelatococcus reniformis]|uniref:ABC transporter ATP-binding protein n=1 Tax=Chelatococcus reniformis TaxID=1494448 RepID=A0A916UNI8_9HYPH|nr:ABC transporter ATP-binding protein [Chelatococcus reniformis]GGC80750.1 ABC transporter ATP-binding protein [Chelatococcus reniformis]